MRASASLDFLRRLVYSAPMTKPDTREQILAAAAPLVHEQGFNHTGLSAILKAAGVPKGSFYHYFENKEAFGLALLEWHVARISEWVRPVLEDPALHPVDRLRRYFELFIEAFEDRGCRRGCPFGNLAQEMSDLSTDFQQHLDTVFERQQERVAHQLSLALEQGAALSFPPQELAAFILSAWQGAMVRAKVAKNTGPLDNFMNTVFGGLIRGPQHTAD